MVTRASHLLCTSVVVLASALTFSARAQQVLPLWPHGTPEPPQTTEAEKDMATAQDRATHGPQTVRLANVTKPTMTVYLPSSLVSTHAAVIVFPGGGYTRLAWDWEGTEACRWVNSLGMACLLVKYRVPDTGHFPDNYAPFEDGQQALRMTRAHAGEWGINPSRVGLLGFSAGGHLAVTLCTHWDDKHVESTPAAADVDAKIDAHPAFAILGYPAYLESKADVNVVDPVMTPVKGTPLTFIIAAENDKTYINSSLAYYRALKDAHVPAELHLYATGGHGFGMHPVGAPEEHWTRLAADWLRGIGILPVTDRGAATSAGTAGVPGTVACPVPQPVLGRPGDPSQATSNDPSCW